MSRNKFELVLGTILIIVPFIGIPMIGKVSITVLIGCIFVTVAVIAHIRRKSAESM